MPSNLPIKKRKRKRKKDTTLTPAIVILNVLIVLILLLMIYFIYEFIMSAENMPAERTTPTSKEKSLAVVESIYDNIESDISEVTTTTIPISMTKAKTTTPETIMSYQDYGDVGDMISSYSSEFFEDDFFIGDSIMTGFVAFGYLPSDRVFAQVGLNPDTALTAKIDDVTLLSTVGNLMPKRIYIMLGTNGLAFLSSEYMADKISVIADELQKISPESEIIIISIPPVTKEHDSKGNETMEKINSYNEKLKNLASDEGYKFIDTCSHLMNSDGYMADNYAENDGLHFVGNAYKAVLSYIEKNLS